MTPIGCVGYTCESSALAFLALVCYFISGYTNDIIPKALKQMAKMKKKTAPALAYLRTSSAADIGADKDSEKRQRAAIETFATHAG